MNFWVEFLGLEYIRMRVMFCKAVKLDFANGCSNMLVELSISLIVEHFVVFFGDFCWPLALTPSYDYQEKTGIQPLTSFNYLQQTQGIQSPSENGNGT